MLLESAFHYLFCLKFSFKLVTFSRVMQENKSGYFSEHSVVVRLCCILTVHLQLFLVMWLLCLCSLCCNGGRHPVFCPMSRYFFRFTKYWTCFQEIYESNLYHQQIKCLHFGWNWNRDSGPGYDRKLQSMFINLAAMSSSCWCLANEFMNFVVHTEADAIKDIISC